MSAPSLVHSGSHVFTNSLDMSGLFLFDQTKATFKACCVHGSEQRGLFKTNKPPLSLLLAMDIRPVQWDTLIHTHVRICTYILNCICILNQNELYIRGGQNYLLPAMDLAKVGGPLSVVKVCIFLLCVKVRYR